MHMDYDEHENIYYCYYMSSICSWNTYILQRVHKKIRCYDRVVIVILITFDRANDKGKFLKTHVFWRVECREETILILSLCCNVIDKVSLKKYCFMKMLMLDVYVQNEMYLASKAKCI